jgi:two-component system sensor histidine kinase KdpD
VTGERPRPDPDRLLASVERERSRARRGKLKVFFGASAGVGKTYAMLEAARAARAAGTEVVVGYVEPHGRSETERLLEGLERLPLLKVGYRGVVRDEFDLDAALERRAAVTLVDELAHSNLVEGEPRPRHPKRWQDVEEMLDAGLDVWTTVNVQHLESLNDVVAGITGARQQETLPDRVFDEADEVELIDLPPDELLARLRAGKVYLPEQARTALERYFRKPNLMALRELALRRTADRVDAAAREYAGLDDVAGTRGSRPLLARDRFLVAIAPDAQAEGLVRVGKRFADALDAEWTVVSVETPAMLRLPEAQRNRRIEVLRLADSLGAETVTLDGPNVADVLLEYARLRNATRLVIGEARRRGWRAWLWPTTAMQLLRRPHGLDVSVIAPRAGVARRTTTTAPHDTSPRPARWERFVAACGISAACTLVALGMDEFFEVTNLVMVFLLGAAIAGLRLGRGPAALTAVVNILCFNFFFVPPRLSFAVSDAQYLVTFAVMLAVALTIATLMASVRQQTRVAGARERRTALLYAMSRELAAARGRDAMQRIATRHVAETFGAQVALLFPDAEGRLQPPGAAAGLAATTADEGSLVYAGADVPVAQWVHDHGREAGLGTDTLPGAPAIYLPLAGSGRPLGALAVLPANPRRVRLPEQRHLLETFAAQIALALERAQFAESAAAARVLAETEQLRNTLLASISHDLRTPLAVITGASSALADPALSIDPGTRARLAGSIADKARDMSTLVTNVLDLMRLESGRLALRRGWEGLDELVGHALHGLGDRLARHHVDVALAADLAPVHVDAALVSQLLANLVDNALRHTPPGTRITVRAPQPGAPGTAGFVAVAVEDDGPGLPPGDPERLFVKFQRGRDEGDVPGAGLGLALCRAIVEAHGGRIDASARPGGGARFTFTLPTQEPAA